VAVPPELRARMKKAGVLAFFEGLSFTHVIVRKLEYFREGGSEKHLRDIRSMLAVSGERMDRAELEQWIRRRELLAQWARIPLP
jgi:hypothetical protein